MTDHTDQSAQPVGAEGKANDFRSKARKALSDIGRIVAPNGIDQTRRMQIGGIEQHIHLRGQDRDAPILLFLHGGPNSVISDVAWSYQRGWEDFFLVVNWDQRGAGRSFGTEGDIPKIRGSLTREQYRSDAIELIEALCREFAREKIVLVGQSWGTVLALEVARERPDLLYIAALQGLAANWLGSANLVYVWYLEEAKKRGDHAEVERLTDVGPVPAGDDPKLTEWAMKFGLPIPNPNTWHNLRDADDGWAERMDILRQLSPDLSPDDYDAEVKRAAEQGEELFARHKEAMAAVGTWDAETDVGVRFEIPIVVMQGGHDWQTHYDLALTYFEKIEAPWKKWVRFPHAAHVLNLEQPGLSVVSLVNDVLPATRGEIPPDSQTGLRQ